MNEKENEEKKVKIEVPVISFEEFLEMERNPFNRKIKGPFKIKAEDAEKAIEYFKNR